MLRTCSEKAFWSRTGPHAYTTTRPPSSSQLLEARTQCQRHGRRLRGCQPLWSARARRVQPSAAPQTTWWRTGATQVLPTSLRRLVGPFRGLTKAKYELNSIAKPLQNVHSHSRSAAAAAAFHAAARHQRPLWPLPMAETQRLVSGARACYPRTSARPLRRRLTLTSCSA